MSNPDFGHVRNPYVREVLEADPGTVTIPKLETALRVTTDCLAADYKNPSVPARALDVRVRQHHRAEKALCRDDVRGAVQALRDCWNDVPVTSAGRQPRPA